MAVPGSNGYQAIEPHIEAMEEIDEKLEQLKINYMNECREFREAQKRRVKMVKAEGFSVVAFKGVLKKRRLEKKIEKVDEEMQEADEAETYEAMQHALGMLSDTPLGQAVLEKADERRKKDAKDIDDLGSEEDKRVTDNVTALKGGIKQLNS